jgi:hypothetical protein
MSAHREVICSQHLSLVVNNVDHRNGVVVARLDDDTLGHTRGLVGLGFIGQAFDDIAETQCTGVLADDHGIEGVPLTNNVSLLDNIVGLEEQRATVWHVQCGQHDVCIEIDELNLGQTAHNHLTFNLGLAALVDERYGTKAVEPQLGVILRFHAGIGSGVLGHTTGVERTERKLCTRLTDSLCRNHADSLSHLHHT